MTNHEMIWTLIVHDESISCYFNIYRREDMAAEDDVLEWTHNLGRPGKIKTARLPSEIISRQNVVDAIEWMKGAEETIAQGIKTLSKFTGGLIREGAFRSVVTTLENRTPFRLQRTNHELSGEFGPTAWIRPSMFQPFPVAVWSSESEGAGTGTEGMVEYVFCHDERFNDIGDAVRGDKNLWFHIHWNNPAIGSNSVSKRWIDSQNHNAVWDNLHLVEPNYIKDNQAHHNWLLRFDP